MSLYVVIAALVVVDAWVTRAVLLTDGLEKKGLHVAMVWIVPFIGAGMTWVHLLPYRRMARAEALPTPSLQPDRPLPLEVSAEGAAPLVLHDALALAHGFPLPHWPTVDAWLAGIGPQVERDEARLRVQRAWLEHLGHALGQPFVLTETEDALILSALEPAVVRATARYVLRARKAIAHVLGGLAQFPAGQKSILLVLDDEERYYHYVSVYYPEGGEFAFSGGMFIDAGCPHFVVTQADLSNIEPVIAHELTHSALSRLQLPLWLDEGLAVNTERKVAGTRAALHTPHELRDMHVAFWGQAQIQEFWSGDSFRRTDDGNLLSYDLARIMVEQMAKSWEAFERFVLEASREDAGAAAAREHLGMDLGATVCALFERPAEASWSPQVAPAA